MDSPVPILGIRAAELEYLALFSAGGSGSLDATGSELKGTALSRIGAPFWWLQLHFSAGGSGSYLKERFKASKKVPHNIAY